MNFREQKKNKEKIFANLGFFLNKVALYFINALYQLVGIHFCNVHTGWNLFDDIACVINWAKKNSVETAMPTPPF